MITTLLILHGLMAVALLGAITHQSISLWCAGRARSSSFVGRYASVNHRAFTHAIILLYAGSFVLGSLIYPSYRLNVRIPFEEMHLGWAVGLFEIKEHFGGIGLALLPCYAFVWHPESADPYRKDRMALTWLLAGIVWWNFLIGHVLNNIRGLG